jgi:hypothetical protein
MKGWLGSFRCPKVTKQATELMHVVFEDQSCVDTGQKSK